MPATVSRSVERVFEILGLFGSRRRPLSATEIGEALGIPHSSAVSLLSRLVLLGYLEQNSISKRYFPSLQLTVLCESVPNGVACGSAPTRVADAVHERHAETTFVSRLSDIFTLPVFVRAATYRGGHVVTTGSAGGLATESLTGQALLSFQTDLDLHHFIRRSEHWARRARVATMFTEAQVKMCVSRIREAGYLCTFDQLLPGLGVISCPLPRAIAAEGLAITVAGPTERVRANVDSILATISEEIDGHYGGAQASPEQVAVSAS